MWKQTGSFEATDSNNRRYTIQILRQYSSSAILDETGATGKTMRLQTPDGQLVHRDGKGRYHLASGLDLVSSDPNAP
jgi:hypothetical protein